MELFKNLSYLSLFNPACQNINNYATLQQMISPLFSFKNNEGAKSTAEEKMFYLFFAWFPDFGMKELEEN